MYYSIGKVTVVKCMAIRISVPVLIPIHLPQSGILASKSPSSPSRLFLLTSSFFACNCFIFFDFFLTFFHLFPTSMQISPLPGLLPPSLQVPFWPVSPPPLPRPFFCSHLPFLPAIVLLHIPPLLTCFPTSLQCYTTQ